MMHFHANSGKNTLKAGIMTFYTKNDHKDIKVY